MSQLLQKFSHFMVVTLKELSHFSSNHTYSNIFHFPVSNYNTTLMLMIYVYLSLTMIAIGNVLLLIKSRRFPIYAISDVAPPQIIFDFVSSSLNQQK